MAKKKPESEEFDFSDIVSNDPPEDDFDFSDIVTPEKKKPKPSSDPLSESEKKLRSGGEDLYSQPAPSEPPGEDIQRNKFERPSTTVKEGLPEHEILSAITNNSTEKKKIIREKRLDELDKLDNGISEGKSAGAGFMQGMASSVSGLPKSVAIAAKHFDIFNEYGDKKVEDLATYKAGEWLDQKAKELFPTNPKFQDEFISSTLPQGAGSMAGFVAAGAAQGGLAVATLGATQNMAQEYKNAIAAGSTEEEAFDVGLKAGAIGSLEGVPVMSFFKRLDNVTGGGVKKYMQHEAIDEITKKFSKFANTTGGAALTGGAEEMVQEVTSGALTNLNAQQSYDKSREIMQGLKEQGAAGLILGSVLNGLGVGLRNKLNDPNISPEDKSIIEDAIIEVDEKIKTDGQVSNEGEREASDPGTAEPSTDKAEPEVSSNEPIGEQVNQGNTEREIENEVKETEKETPSTNESGTGSGGQGTPEAEGSGQPIPEHEVNAEVKPEREIKSVFNNIIERSTTVSEEVKGNLKANLHYDKLSNKQSQSLARDFIKEYPSHMDAAQAVLGAGKDMNGAVKTMVLNEAITDITKRHLKEADPKIKDQLAEQQSKLIYDLDEYARDAGRSVQAISHLYKATPMGMKLAQKKKIEKYNDEIRARKTSSAPTKADFETAVSQAAEETVKDKKFKKVVEKTKFAKDVKDQSDKVKKESLKIKKDKAKVELDDLFKQFNDKANSGIDPVLTGKIVAKATEYGYYVIREGATDFVEWSKKMQSELGTSITPHLAEIWDSSHEGEKLNDVAGAVRKTNLRPIYRDTWETYKENAQLRIRNLISGGGSPSEKSAIQEFTKRLVHNISKSDPKSSKPVDSRSKLREVVQNIDKYRDVISETLKASPELSGKLKDVLEMPFFKSDLSAVVDQSMPERLSDIAKDFHSKQENIGKDMAEKISAELGVSEEDAKELSSQINDIYKEKLKAKQIDLLSKKYSSRVTDLFDSKKKKAIDKIVEAVNLGTLNDEVFQNAFNDSLGLINIDNAKVKETIDSLVGKISRSEEGVVREKYQKELLDYIESLKKQSFVNLGVSYAYANMLSSYESHLRNLSFGGGAFLKQQAKAILWPSHKNLAKAIVGIKSFNQALVDAKEALRTGFREGMSAEQKSGDVLSTRKNAFLRSLSFIMNGLSAEDALFNRPLGNMQQAGALIDAAIKQEAAKKMADPGYIPKSAKQIAKEVNDSFKWTDRGFKSQAAKEVESAEELKEPLYLESIEKYIDPNGRQQEHKVFKRNPVYKDKKYNKLYRTAKQRAWELAEKERDPDGVITEDAKVWAKEQLLIGRPKGLAGVISDILNNIGANLPVIKLMSTAFVNVPLNTMNYLVENGPIGTVTLSGQMIKSMVTGQPMNEGLFVSKPNEVVTEARKSQLFKRQLAFYSLAGSIYMLSKIDVEDEEGKKVPLITVTANGTGDYAKNQDLQQGTGTFKEYSITIAGTQFSYKTSPFAPFLLPIGMMSDYSKYRGGFDNLSLGKKMAIIMMSYGDFTMDQASLKGLADITDLFKPDKGGDFGENDIDKKLEKLGKQASKKMVTLLFPASGFLKASNNDIKGIVEADDRQAAEWYEYMVRDLPFLDMASHLKIDHLGRPIKEVTDIPLLYNGNYKKDPYYAACKEYGYNNKYYYEQTITDPDDSDNVLPATKEDLYEINKFRGEYVQKELMEGGGLEKITGEASKIEDKVERDEYFKSEMDILFTEGLDEAKSKFIESKTK
jgi:hypothetical protein